jgi:hypothetical protein
MLLARAFSEMADDRGSAREFAAALEASLRSAGQRYGTTPQEFDSLTEWLAEECGVRRRPAALTAALAVATQVGVAESAVTQRLRAALANGAASEPGLAVLALTEALEGVVAAIDEIVPGPEGAVA